jgi:alpha-beta hydrolase superfamily lysophospholipase
MKRGELPGDGDDIISMEILDVTRDRPDGEYLPFRLLTNRGDVTCRSYPAAGARHGAVWVGGVGGDFDTPAHGLYPRLCQELQGRGVASLRVQFRHPADLGESILDVLAGIAYLEGEGARELLLTGHSFGGAVVIQAAAAAGAVRAVVALATQSHGTEPAARLGPRCALLLVHGTADRVLPPSCSESVYRRAKEPKRLVLPEGAGHKLDEAADAVAGEVLGWADTRLLAEAV